MSGILQGVNNPAHDVGDGGVDLWVGAAEPLHHCCADEQCVVAQALKKLPSLGRVVFGHVPGGLELPISLQQQQQQQQQLVRPPSLWRRRGATVRATTTKGGGRAPALTSLAVSQAVLSCRAAQSTSLTAATTIATLVWSVKAARWVG